MNLGNSFKIIVIITSLYGCGLFCGYFTSQKTIISEAEKESPKPRFSLKEKKAQTTATFRSQEDRDFWLNLSQPNSSHSFKTEFLKLTKDFNFSQPNASLNFDKINYLLAQWAVFAPQEALETVDSLPQSFRKIFAHKVYESWGTHNPEKLAQFYLDQRQNNMSLTEALYSAMNGWSKSAPKDALKWLNTHVKNSYEYNEGAQAILSGMIDEQPQQIRKILEALPQDYFNNQNALKNFLASWTLADPSFAKEWINQLPPHQLEFAQVYKDVSSLPLEEAATYYQTNPQLLLDTMATYPAERQSYLWLNFLSNLALSEGVDYAQQWRDTYLSENEIALEFNIFDSSVQNKFITQHDLEQKILNAKGNLTKEELIDHYKKMISPHQYERAFHFFEQIKDNDSALHVLSQWGIKEPEKAQSQLKNSSLFSDEEKKRSFSSPSIMLPYLKK